MDRVSDEALLRMLREVEDAEELADAAFAADEDEEEAPLHDPCLFCGEPAEHRGVCMLCDEEGCLPPDLWSPGMADPCLTMCVRCGRSIHLACSAADEAGNPRCPTCHY